MTSEHKKKSKSYRKKKKTSNPTLKRKIALIGFRAVGKSIIAQELAKLYGVNSLSMDRYLEKKESQSIEKITQEKGWEYFREQELVALQEVTQKDEIFILDTGGGIVENADGTISKEKIDILRKSFFCIYLTMQDEKLLKRLREIGKNRSRPGLPQANDVVLKRRKPMYIKAAHAIVDVGGIAKNEVTARIRSLLG